MIWLTFEEITGRLVIERGSPLYLIFHLSLSGTDWMGRWSCLPACRREGSGADELVSPRRQFKAEREMSLSRWLLCPKLEPLIERPSKASSYLQE